MTKDYDTNAMVERLKTELKIRDISERSAATKAGLSGGYIHSISGGSEPSIAKISKICAANNISLAYVLLGFEMTPAAERLLSLIEREPGKLDAVLALLQPNPADQQDQ